MTRNLRNPIIFILLLMQTLLSSDLHNLSSSNPKPLAKRPMEDSTMSAGEPIT